MLGTRMKSAMRCMPWSASSSGVSFLAPRRRMLVAPLAKASEMELPPGAKPWRSRRVRRPARGQARLVLREDHVGVAQAAVVGHGADAGQGAAQVLLEQAQRAADAGARRPLRIRARGSRSRSSGGSAAPIGPLTITTGNGAARGGLQLLAARLGIEERLHRGHEHRQVLGPPARHRERDGAGLDRGHAAARRKLAEARGREAAPRR